MEIMHILTHILCICAVGTLAAQCAFFRGASRVVLIDREADRLQFAKDRIPKLETLNFGDKKARPFACYAVVHVHRVGTHPLLPSLHGQHFSSSDTPIAFLIMFSATFRLGCCQVH